MNENNYILPNFIMIGTGRSGTTFLYESLKQHPDIFLKSSKRPEPHFFVRDSEYEKGLDYYSDKFFSEYNGEKAIGEASTSTYSFEKAAKRIQQMQPSMKIIITLRNPIDRMFSEYWQSVDNGYENLSFEDAIAKEEERISNPRNEYYKDFDPDGYMKRSYYFKYITMWLRYFSQEQIKIVLFEDTIQKPKETIKEIFNFLNVDDVVVPNFSKSDKNASSRATYKMNKKIKVFLQNELRNDIENLEKLLNRDLSKWYK